MLRNNLILRWFRNRPLNFLRFGGITYALLTAIIFRIWQVDQNILFNKDCDRAKIDLYPSWYDTVIPVALFAIPLLLAKSRAVLNPCFYIEIFYFSLVNINALLTLHAEDWECYTMGGDTNFGEDTFFPILFGLPIFIVFTLAAAYDRIKFLYGKFIVFLNANK